MTTVLDLGCGLFWSITYVLAIAIGFRRKTYCIPMISICMNFSWELLVVIERINNGTIGTIGFLIQLIWCLLDLGIIATWWLYGARNIKMKIAGILSFGLVFLTMYIVTICGKEWTTSVFLINMIMSAEFLIRFRNDRSCWAVMLIAITKLLGTLFATILNGLIWNNLFVVWAGGICLILDLWYVAKIREKERA